MRNLLTCALLLTLVSTAALAADDQAIKDRLNEFKAAWEKDDSKAMAAQWAEDGSLYNPVGRYAQGPAEIAKLFDDEHAVMFKQSKYEIGEVKIQQVTPDVAIADVTATVVGVHTPDGAAAPDYAHHVIWVFVKKDGKWMAAAARPYKFGEKK